MTSYEISKILSSVSFQHHQMVLRILNRRIWIFSPQKWMFIYIYYYTRINIVTKPLQNSYVDGGFVKLSDYLSSNHDDGKVLYPKYSKHWPYTVAHTIYWVCNKMLNHGLNYNYGLLLSHFKLIPCHIELYMC